MQSSLTSGSARVSFFKARTLATIATGVCLLLFFSWAFFLIQKGQLTNMDEFMTAERSREMLLFGPWSVHQNFQVSFEKPPLQYWLGALTLSHWEGRELALRIWPLFFGALSCITIGALAFRLSHKRTWCVTATIAILLCCPLFFPEMCRALLDVGLTFFTIAALYFAHLARKRPAWWCAVGIACVLGALQKVPLVFLVWIIVITTRYLRKNERATLRSRWLPLAFFGALACVAVWPAGQLHFYGMPAARIFGAGEALDLMGPSRLGSRSFFEIPFRLVTTWPCGIFALGAAIYFLRPCAAGAEIAEIAIVSLTVVSLCVLFQFRSVRYITPVLPCFALLLAVLLQKWMREKGRWKIAGAILIVILSLGGVEVSRRFIDNRRKDYRAHIETARHLSRLQSANRPTILVEPNHHILPEPFYLFYGNLKFPVTGIRLTEMNVRTLSANSVGVCREADFAEVQRLFGDARIEFKCSDEICWRASAPALINP